MSVFVPFKTQGGTKPNGGVDSTSRLSRPFSLSVNPDRGRHRIYMLVTQKATLGRKKIAGRRPSAASRKDRRNSCFSRAITSDITLRMRPVSASLQAARRDHQEGIAGRGTTDANTRTCICLFCGRRSSRTEERSCPPAPHSPAPALKVWTRAGSCGLRRVHPRRKRTCTSPEDTRKDRN